MKDQITLAKLSADKIIKFGVADGTRTHDDQNHNLGLYQLSYSHRRATQYNGTQEAAAAGLLTLMSALWRRCSWSR